MAFQKVKYLLLLSISIFITYIIVLSEHYSAINRIIVTHINYSGEADKYGDKIGLWYAAGVNFVLLLVICIGISYSNYWNYPEGLTNEGREKFLIKMNYLLSTIAIVISILFSTMIFKEIEISSNLINYSLFLILSPVAVLYYFGRN